jgi:hypothetical protein
MKIVRLPPAERAAIRRKWRRASAKAHVTARNAKLFAKYALGKTGWKVASLDTRKGFEYKGVVDLVAVKRNNRSPDELTVMLVQVKGGTARVTQEGDFEASQSCKSFAGEMEMEGGTKAG